MTFEDLEQKIVASLDQAKFEQPEFEQKLGIGKSELLQGVGGALTGTVEGMISRFIPMSLPSGVASIAGGIVIGKFLGKSGMVADLAKGITVGGIATLVSGFIGGKFMQVQKEVPQVASTQKFEGVIF